jgi:hypothetical protein
MTDNERAQYEANLKLLKPEQAAQWTDDVREAWLRVRRARKVWRATRTPATRCLGSIKEDGRATPLFIPNLEYIKYEEAWIDYCKNYQPKYIFEDRARAGEEDDSYDWKKA